MLLLLDHLQSWLPCLFGLNFLQLNIFRARLQQHLLILFAGGGTVIDLRSLLGQLWLVRIFKLPLKAFNDLIDQLLFGG